MQSSARGMMTAVVALAMATPLLAQTPAAEARPAPLPSSGTIAANPAVEAKMRSEVKAPVGWDVRLFAGPPVAMYPTCLSESPDGALFVCVDPNLSLSAIKGIGRVMRLVDDNNDGRADRYTTFAEMDSPRGVAFDGETLYVMHPPSLTAFRDTNGDGISDWKKELVSGLGFDLDFRGADHTTNGITMGIDGWLYIAVGDYGFRRAVGADGTEIAHRGGAVVRVRPDGTNLEIYAINTRNIYDVAVDPFLNVFTRDNTNDGDGWNTRLHYVAPGADLGYPNLYKNFPTEHFPSLADYGGGSGVGGLWIQDPAFPEGYNNTLYTADWTVNRVFRQPLTPKGASFDVKQEEFLTFVRPTDLVVDHHSNLYVSSLSGGQFRYASDTVGYVVRITPPGLTARPAVVRPANPTDAQLISQLLSPRAIDRLQAQQGILKRGPKAAYTRALEQVVTNAQHSAEARVAAMFTLKQLIGARANAALVRATSDADPRVRALALRALADRKDQVAGVNPSVFVRALDDADDHVKVQALNGLVRLDARSAASAIVPLTASSDQALSHLAVNALVRLEAREAALQALDSGSPAAQAGALRALGQMHTAETVAALSQRLERAPAAARAPILQTLARLYNREAAWEGDWWTTRPSFIGPYFNPATWEGSPSIRPALRQALLTATGDEFARLTDDLMRFRVLPQGSKTLLVALTSANDPQRTQVIDALVGSSTLTDSHAELLAGLNAKSPLLRTAVAELVAGQATVPASMTGILRSAALDPSLDGEVRGRLLNAMMAAPGQAGTEAAVAVLTQLNPSEAAPAAGASPVEAAWRRFIGHQRRATELDYFINLSRTGDPAQRVLAYSVLVQQVRGPRLQGADREKVVRAIDAGWTDTAAAPHLVRAINVMGVQGQYSERLQPYSAAPK
ncbi:MAG: heme-binding domain-containing protein [Gemmatimonadetes bacterium]|nr:heme-binding domain-containing protein [Gemmatimonadota bacterium]